MIFGIVLIGSFFLLVILNVPIAVSLGVSSLIGLWYGDISYDMLAPTIYASINKFSLLAIPFFILAGLIIERAGISKRLIYFIETLIGGIRGGLAVATVVVAVIFAAISGSGPATVAALGVILIPAMISKGYSPGMSGALLSSAGSIGIIIPPSIAFIIYASLVQVSVAEIFIAGVIPGLLLAVALILCSYYLIRNNNKITSSKGYPLKDKLKAFKDAIWGLLAPVIILGGIYSGIFTPTESAGIAVVYGLFVGIFIYKEIKMKELFKVLVDSAVSTAVVMFIVSFATVFAWLLTTSMLANDIANGILSLSSNQILILILLNILFLIAGFFLDTISAYFILIPVVLPIATNLGIDPIHLGVFLTVNLAVGQFTPPVGVNLYVAANIGKIPLPSLLKNIVPYIIVSFLVVLLLTFVPWFSLWLPSLLDY